MRHSRYQIIENKTGEPLVIRDVGPWDKHPSVTNDAENVVLELTASGLLARGRRLFYIDSDGAKDELLHDNGRFLGFAPGPERLHPCGHL